MIDILFLLKIFTLLVFSGSTIVIGEFLIKSINNNMYQIIILLLAVVMLSNLTAKTITIFLERKTISD